MAQQTIAISPELIAEAVKRAMASLGESNGSNGGTTTLTKAAGKLDAKNDFPLSRKRPDLVRSATGLSLDDITLEKATSGKLSF